MRALDDCHNYEMDTVLNAPEKPRLSFYEMRENGQKLDGVTNEEVLDVLIHRIHFLNEKMQGGKFWCEENHCAWESLLEARMWLVERTGQRVARKVEGTHEK